MNIEEKLAVHDATRHLEGWFFRADAVAFTLILYLQHRMNVRGNLGELGVFHGKSTLFLSLFAGDGERVIGVDSFPEDTLAKATEALKTHGNPEATELKTIDIYADGLPRGLFGGARFTHVDAGHRYDQARHDISFCSHETLETGVMAIDDAFHPDFPGVQEATYEYLFAGEIGRNKRIFCTTPNKIYIADQAYADRYVGALRTFLDHMQADYFLERGAKGNRIVMFPRFKPDEENTAHDA